MAASKLMDLPALRAGARHRAIERFARVARRSDVDFPGNALPRPRQRQSLQKALQRLRRASPVDPRAVLLVDMEKRRRPWRNGRCAARFRRPKSVLYRLWLEIDHGFARAPRGTHRPARRTIWPFPSSPRHLK